MPVELSKANEAIMSSEFSDAEKGQLLAFVGKLHQENRLKDVNVNADCPLPIMAHALLATMRLGDLRARNQVFRYLSPESLSSIEISRKALPEASGGGGSGGCRNEVPRGAKWRALIFSANMCLLRSICPYSP